MADTVLKIIPDGPYFRVSQEALQQAVRYLREETEADSVTCSQSETPVFVDCGGNLERITCPVCKKPIDFSWWGSAMDQAYANGFHDLRVKLPCCGEESALNALGYDSPCGFSCVSVQILNPSAHLTDRQITRIQELLGTAVRVITARV